MRFATLLHKHGMVWYDVVFAEMIEQEKKKKKIHRKNEKIVHRLTRQLVLADCAVGEWSLNEDRCQSA